jgi:transcriptional regulator with XRE-family HTH domain
MRSISLLYIFDNSAGKADMASSFSAYFRELRMRKGWTLRAFCHANGLDPGNISRLERGISSPPESQPKLRQYARSLGLKKGSKEWIEFFDYAAVARRQLPADLRGDERVLERLPALFHTLRTGKVESRVKMHWMEGSDLNLWASSRRCQEDMPKLVRRLIRETVPGPARVEFRSAEGVQLAGWDGIVEAPEGNSYVPRGASFWEIGTAAAVRKKADHDYKVRTANPLGADRPSSTFVFATPRRWGGKNKWAAEKKSKGDWADVRAYDADDFEQWLELAPSTGAWLAWHIGKYPRGVRCLEAFWAEFSVATSPELSPAVPVAGREEAVKRLHEWLHSGSGILRVRGESTAEVMAFISAAIQQSQEEDLAQRAARCLIVDDVAMAREIISVRNPLTLLWNVSETDAVPAAIERGHTVILPEDRSGMPLAKDDIELPRLSAEGLIQALSQCGLNEERAREVVGATGGRIQPLRRQLARVPNLARPQWAEPEHATELIRLLFAGSWDERQDGDRKVVEALAQVPWEAVSKTAAAYIRGDDAPLRCARGIWQFVSPFDAWHLLGGYIGLQDLDRFVRIAVEVLSHESSRSALPPDRRWMAMDGEFPHSHVLRQGLARTTSLLAVLGEQDIVGGRPQDSAKRIVLKLLDSGAGWQRWYSLAGLLPYLAEAAPDEFLAALDDFLTRDPASVSQLFIEEGPLGGNSPHTHILWALELLAWVPQYLGQVAVVLGKLAALDPGGKLANRPVESLAEIFLLWHPNTGATLQQRFQAIDLLLDRESLVAWKLLISLLPRFHSVGMPTYKPEWRQYRVPSPVTVGEHLRGIEEVINRSLRAAGHDSTRLATLIKECGAWPPESRSALVVHIESVSSNNRNPGERNEVWEALRDLVNTHRAFATADWALPESEVKKLEVLLPLVEPSDVFTKFKWLFDDWYPRLPGSGLDVTEGQKQIDRRRIEAVRSVLAERGVTGVLSLSRVVKYPHFVGQSASALVPSVEVEEEILLSTLGSKEERLRKLAMGFVYDRYVRMGDEWADKALPLVRPDHQALATFFLALPVSRTVWDRVALEGPQVERLYWEEVPPYLGTSGALSDIQFAIEHLHTAQRVGCLVGVASMNVSRLPGRDLVRALDSAIEALAEKRMDLTQDFTFSTTEILSALPSKPDVTEETVARLEWAFLPLVHLRRLPASLALHRRLAQDPTFFAEVIALVYRPKLTKEEGSKKVPEPSEEQRARARLGYDLLRSWRLVPGIATHGSLDGTALEHWIKQARERCMESGHADIGDVHIGQVLSYAPVGSDGVWPHEAVRSVLEQQASREMDTGFSTGVFNSRGVVTKNIGEGGGQERTLADRFRRHAEGLNITCPRTARLLRAIADHYEREGHWEDEASSLQA